MSKLALIWTESWTYSFNLIVENNFFLDWVPNIYSDPVKKFDQNIIFASLQQSEKSGENQEFFIMAWILQPEVPTAKFICAVTLSYCVNRFTHIG